MSVHHTITKSVATLGAVISEPTPGTFRIEMEGVLIAEGTNAKDVAAEAKETIGADDFDLEALREEQASEKDDEGATGEDEAEDGEGGSVVKPAYRTRYKEIDANDSNGDALALALRREITDHDEKGRPTGANMARFEAVLRANGLELTTKGRNPGHNRMISGNELRGLWRNGRDIVIGSETIPATDEAKAKAAARFEAEKAKAEREAAKPTPAEDEPKAE